jgi:hypothetical protein|tara:strand:+ start:1587 stop:1712 length:126 start_codon:yes stop_codon:yes gene_type:complete
MNWGRSERNLGEGFVETNFETKKEKQVRDAKQPRELLDAGT